MTEHDEDVARAVLSYKANAYYSSAAGDQISEWLHRFTKLNLVDKD